MGRRHGIIPARAGFTSAGRQGEGDARDHPRSRGVYQISIYVRDFHTGSSPLARGLRFQATIFGLCSRIIPARAGFTRERSRLAWVVRDHPRSRGVYRSPHGTRPHGKGSSPLARGLHIRTRHHPPKLRIIPARAGFTDCRNIIGRIHGDHPRSRGVYNPKKYEPTALSGSSPLARGLQKPALALEAKARIIPARAGFTLMRRTPWWVHRDHPRSRGVYDAVPCER